MRNYFNLNLSSRQRAKIVSEDLGSVWDATSEFLGVGFQSRVFFFPANLPGAILGVADDIGKLNPPFSLFRGFQCISFDNQASLCFCENVLLQKKVFSMGLF